jgi:hypothetical protein
MDESRVELIRRAEQEIDRNCTGETEYGEWWRRFGTGEYVIMQLMSREIARDFQVLPLPVLESLLGAFVALHKRAYVMWREYGELRSLCSPMSSSSRTERRR